jgi:hypothetical protein
MPPERNGPQVMLKSLTEPLLVEAMGRPVGLGDALGPIKR